MNKGRRLLELAGVIILVFLGLKLFNKKEKTPDEWRDDLADEIASDYFDRGKHFFEQRDYEASARMMVKGTQVQGISKPLLARLYQNVAVVYEERYMKDSAIYYLKKNAELYDASSFEYLVAQAGVYELERKIDSAILLFQQAWVLNSSDLTTNNNLGLLFMGYRGSDTINYKQALIYNLKAHERSPQRTTEENLILNYRGLERYDKVAEHYHNLTKRFPQESSYIYNLACVYYDHLKKVELARKYATMLVEMDSSYTDHYKVKEIQARE